MKEWVSNFVYNETCVCGASINIAESYEYISFEELGEQFKTWQQRHSQ